MKAKPHIPYDGPIVTRDVALASGLKRFFMGIACFKSHVSERYVKTDRCITCHAAVVAKYNARNPEIRRRAKSKYNASERGIEANRISSAKMHAKRPTRSADWKKSNPGLANAQVSARKAAKIRATPPWADMDAIAEIYKQCSDIQRTTGIPHHVDHIIPLRGKSVCGLHVHWNLRAIPAVENIRKQAMLIPELLTAAGLPAKGPAQGNLFLCAAA